MNRSGTDKSCEGRSLAAPVTETDAAATPEHSSVAATRSPRELIWLRFRRHRLGRLALDFVVLLYLVALFAEFIAPHTPYSHDLDHIHAPPQIVRFDFETGVYFHPLILSQDPRTLRRNYHEDRSRKVPLGLFVKGEPYRLWGVIPLERRLFGVETESVSQLDATGSAKASPMRFYCLGADAYGRDLFSRTIYGARTSLTIGLLAVFLTIVLGAIIGGVSGYLGGAADNFIQRSIEIINSFPQLPLWLALGAIFPEDWSSLRIYFMITLVLSIFGWTGLARVVRGKILSLREEEYVLAARLTGASSGRIIARHLIPGFTSHIIVVVTLSVPGMILGETALSFLGLGLRPPVVSWGVMLQDCMNVQVLAQHPWLLLPAFAIIATVLAFNFLGDALRDAIDPYS